MGILRVPMLGLSKQRGLFVVPLPMKSLFTDVSLSGLFQRICETKNKKQKCGKKLHYKKIVVNIPLHDSIWLKQVLHLVLPIFIAATNSCSVYFKERVKITVCPF